jgi:hypothetical protein
VLLSKRNMVVFNVKRMIKLTSNICYVSVPLTYPVKRQLAILFLRVNNPPSETSEVARVLAHSEEIRRAAECVVSGTLVAVSLLVPQTLTHPCQFQGLRQVELSTHDEFATNQTLLALVLALQLMRYDVEQNQPVRMGKASQESRN